MTIPPPEIIPDDPDQLPPARRRRARRLLTPLDADERSAFYERMAHRVSPTFDFFLLSLISGAVLGLAMILDQPALMVLGVILAPLMSPMIGVSLGTALGAGRFFVRSLGAFLVGGFFVFVFGMIAGTVGRDLFPEPVTLYYLTRLHTRLAWIPFLAVGIGAFMSAAWLARGKSRALSYSALLAYGFYVPLSAAGFGVSIGLPHLWPDGLLVFGLHFAGAALIGALVLGIMGYRPPTLFGYTLGGVLVLAGVLFIVIIAGAGIALGGQVAIPTFTPSPTPTRPPPTATLTPTRTPVPPSATATASITPSPTITRTPSPVPPSPTPTPVLAAVDVPGFDGARVRREPNGPTLTVLANGTIVQLIGEEEEIDNRIWVLVRTLDDDPIEGWMVSTLLTLQLPDQ